MKDENRKLCPGLPEKGVHCQSTKLFEKTRTLPSGLSSKISPMFSLVNSILLYVCETWTFTAELETKIQATVLRCFRRLLDISYVDYLTNEEVRSSVRHTIGSYEDLITTVRKRILRWYRHITRSKGFAKMILQGTVQGGRRKGRQKKRWQDNMTECAGLGLNPFERLRTELNKEMWLFDYP